MAKVLKSSLPYKGPVSENLVDLIRTGLRKNGDHVILIDSKTGRSWKGSDIEFCITFMAKMLLDDGLEKGDVCSVYGEESDQIAILLLAIIIAGGVPNYLTNKSSGREVHDTASVLKSKFLFAKQDLLDKIEPDLSDLFESSKIQLVPYDPEENLNKFGQNFKKFFNSGCIFCDDDDKFFNGLVNKINPEKDYAIFQFSSGTTGKPKPIPRTHKNLCHLVASVDHEELMDLRPGVIITGCLPITHRPGLWAILASINCGSTFVIWSPTDVEDALKTIEKYKVTIFSSSLPFLSMLGNIGIKMKDRFDTSSWKHIITSGAKIVNPDLPKNLIEAFKLDSLRQCFGMTESGWIFLVEKSLAKDNYLTVGHVVPGTEAIVVQHDDSKRRLGPMEHGEIALKGPQIFPGYVTDDPSVLNRSDFTEDGWFKIGDQAYYDDSDLIFIKGRYKEVMMFENNCLYFPDEIEAIISEHPAIECACVVKIGEVRHDYPYDVARGFVTLKQGSTVDESQLLKFVNEKTPQVILAGGIRILDKFARLQNGKIDKQLLKTLP